MSSCPDISVSDSTYDANAVDRSIGETLAEVFSQRDNAKSNANSNHTFACTECMETFMTENGLSSHNATSHQFKKDKYCDLCSDSFFTFEVVQTHKVHAHKVLVKVDDNRVTEEVLQISDSIEKKHATVDLAVMDSDSAEVISSDDTPEPVKTDETPEKKPVKTDETPEKEPVKTDETPEKEPVKTDEVPVKTDETPVKTDKVPVKTPEKECAKVRNL